MSYCRFIEGDVYVFVDVGLGLRCCFCRMQEREWVDEPGRPLFGGYFKDIGEKVHADGLTTDEMIAHLRQHRERGDIVPDDVFTELEADRDENDAFLASLAAL